MKKMLLFLFLLAPLYVMAEEIPVVVITQDSLGNRTLTFTLAEDSTATGKDGKPGTYRVSDTHYVRYVSNIPIWVGNDSSNLITKAVFDKSFLRANITSTAYWFYNLTNLQPIEDLDNLNTQNVTDMSSMFRGCSKLTSLDVSNFKTDNVVDMSSMFYNCRSLTNLDVSKFNTDKVTDMDAMFRNCRSLTSL